MNKINLTNDKQNVNEQQQYTSNLDFILNTQDKQEFFVDRQNPVFESFIQKVENVINDLNNRITQLEQQIIGKQSLQEILLKIQKNQNQQLQELKVQINLQLCSFEEQIQNEKRFFLKEKQQYQDIDSHLKKFEESLMHKCHKKNEELNKKFEFFVQNFNPFENFDLNELSNQISVIQKNVFDYQNKTDYNLEQFKKQLDQTQLNQESLKNNIQLEQQNTQNVENDVLTIMEMTGKLKIELQQIQTDQYAIQQFFINQGSKLINS